MMSLNAPGGSTLQWGTGRGLPSTIWWLHNFDDV